MDPNGDQHGTDSAPWRAASTRDPLSAARAFGPARPAVGLVGPVMRRVRTFPAPARQHALGWRRWAPHAAGVLAAWALWMSPVLRPLDAGLLGVAADLGARGLVVAASVLGTAARAGLALWPVLLAGTAAAVALEALVLTRWLSTPAR